MAEAVATMKGSVVELHSQSSSESLKTLKRAVETICEQVTREGTVRKGQVELAHLAAVNAASAIKGSKALRQGRSWTSLKAKAGLADDDSMQQAFRELEKDVQACHLLIRRLRAGEASEETLKTLTSIKVTSSEMSSNFQQFLDTEAKTTMAKMAQSMVAADVTSLDISVMSELRPKSLALLLVSVSHEMQQQLLAEATTLGAVRKMRLLLAVQSVRRSYSRMHHLRRKYQKQLQELHKSNMPTKKHVEASSGAPNWSARTIFSACWQGSKYLSFKQASTIDQDLTKASGELIKAVRMETSSSEQPQPQPEPRQQQPLCTDKLDAVSSTPSCSMSSMCNSASMLDSPAVAGAEGPARESSQKPLMTGRGSSSAIEAPADASSNAQGGGLHETISATIDQLRMHLGRSTSNERETPAAAAVSADTVKAQQEIIAMP